MSAASEHREAVFTQFAEPDGFVPCFARETVEGHDRCTNRNGGLCLPGHMEAAHLYPKSWIFNRIRAMKLRERNEDHPLLSVPAEEIIYDYRNAVPLCPEAHEQWDKRGRRCSYDDLPPLFLEYLHEYHVLHWARELYAETNRVDHTGEALRW